MIHNVNIMCHMFVNVNKRGVTILYYLCVTQCTVGGPVYVLQVQNTVTVLLEDVVAATETGWANVVKFHASMERTKMAMERASATSLVTTASAVTSSALVTACAVRAGHAGVTTTTVMEGNTATSSHVPDGRLCVRDAENVCPRACVHADLVSVAMPVRHPTVPASQTVKDFKEPTAVS